MKHLTEADLRVVETVLTTTGLDCTSYVPMLLDEVRYLRAGYDAFLNPDVVCPYSLRKHARAVLDGTFKGEKE